VPALLIRFRFLSLSIVCLVLTVSGFSQKYVFNKAVFSTGKGPSALAIADFNGDGIADLVVANATDNTVSFLAGKADATFAAKVDFAVGVAPVAIALGDFNHDGALDMAVANATANTVSILLGNGAGGFSPHVDYAVGNDPLGVAVQDFNGDGVLDLVTANSKDGTISVLLGKGDGTFGPHTDFAAGGTPKSVAVADLNHDGKFDVVVPDKSIAQVAVLLGNGDGTFKTKVLYSTATGPVAVAIGDLNGDGNPDLVVACNIAVNEPGAASVLLGNGDGTFTSHQDYPTGTSPFAVGLADLNSDGKLDVVVAEANTIQGDFLLPGGASVLLGNGDGSLALQTSYATGAKPEGLALADITGDGRLDLITANNSDNSVSVVPGVGDGTFSSGSLLSMPSKSFGFGQIVSADLNRDGNLDLTYVDADLSVVLGTAAGGFGPRQDFAAGSAPVALALGDFNGDGILDAAVVDNTNSLTNSLSILLGNGDGTFQAPVSYTLGESPTAVVVADFNRDGKLDLAVSVFNSLQISVLYGNGDGTFQSPVTFATGGVQPISLVAADFNGDGFPDIAFTQNFHSSVGVLLNNGAGGFGSPVNYGTQNDTYGITAADLNLDGRMDLVVTSNTFDGFFVMLGHGDGTFSSSTGYRVGLLASVGSAVVGDFNGDGCPDIAAGLDYLSLYFGNCRGRFQPHVDYLMLQPTAFSIAAGDFSHSNALDVVSAPVSDTEGSVLYNNPVIALFPQALAFGSVPVGQTSPPLAEQISNPAVAALNLSSFSISGPNAGDFNMTTTCSLTIASGKNCAIDVTFSPRAKGSRSATLTITSASRVSYNISLNGSGT
jgi:hypothetical protein